MSYHEEELPLKRDDSKQAIALAMQGRWREAIAINKSLIESFPDDVGAYNRLGRAYMELGEYSQAMEAYRRAAELDPYNAIAKKNVQRLSRLEKNTVSAVAETEKIEPQHFIEEVGKAGIINLHNLAPPQVVAVVVAGDMVNLKIDGANLLVEDSRGEYLGQVETRHGQRLVKLMEGGNRYSAAVTSASENKISVIIREVYQDPSQLGKLSFPLQRYEGVQPYVSDRLIRHELETSETSPEEPGYTIVGGDETELLTEESNDVDDELEDSEE